MGGCGIICLCGRIGWCVCVGGVWDELTTDRNILTLLYQVPGCICLSVGEGARLCLHRKSTLNSALTGNQRIATQNDRLSTRN